MASDTVQLHKRELRRRARSIPLADASARRRVCEHLLALPQLGRARTIAVYAAFAHEVSLDPVCVWLVGREAALVWPRVHDSTLQFHSASPAELSPGYRGIAEPPDDAPRVETDRIDVFLVPGVLFDRRGRRLGRGLGHYDRALARAAADAYRVGVCNACRLVDELPEEPQDVAMHAIVTEDGIVQRTEP